MLIALHRDTGYILRNSEICYAESWAEILEAQGVDIRWVDLTDHDPFGQVKGCDGVMWHHGGRLDDKLKANRILHSIELYLGIPVYPDHYASWHYDEKLAVHYMLKAADVPTPPTWVFWNKEEAIEWANQTDYPKVFKLSTGDSGKNIVKVDSSKEARRLIERMFGVGIYSGSLHKEQVSGISRKRRLVGRFREGIRHALTGEPVGVSRSKNIILEKGYAYFQEFLPHDFETIIRVIGDQIWASRSFPLPGEFRISGHTLRQGQVSARPSDRDPSQIDLRCVRMAFDMCERLGFSAMKMSILFHDGDPVVSDICYTISPDNPDSPPFPGIWNRNLEWTEGVRSRKEAEVNTFLEKVRSGQRPQLQPALTSLELLP